MEGGVADDTLYAKTGTGRGTRYVPVARHWDCDVWPHGHHLVYIPDDGGRSIRYGVDPDRVGVLAALREHRDVIQRAVAKAMKERPSLDDETAARALEAYRAAGGLPSFAYHVASAGDVLAALERALADVTRG